MLFISHDSALQGAERVLYDTVVALNKGALLATVVVPFNGPLSDALRAANVKVYQRFVDRWIPSQRKRGFHHLKEWIAQARSRVWSIAKLIETENIALVYTNTSTVIDGAIAARLMKIPHIWHLHEHLSKNPDATPYIPLKWTDKIISTLADQIVAPTHKVIANRFKDTTPNRLHVIPNGVNLPQLESSPREAIAHDFKGSRSSNIVTFVGSLTKTKDPETFVAAAEIVLKSHKDTIFLIIGNSDESDYANLIRTRIKTADLGNRIHLLGYRNDVQEILRYSSVHVSTSTRESFGKTLIEAMAHGVPVVATRCGGPEEFITNEVNGILVDPKTPHKTAEAICRLLSDKDLRRRLGRSGRESVEQNFDLRRTTEQIRALIVSTIRNQVHPSDDCTRPA